jgi:hypothetical protein
LQALLALSQHFGKSSLSSEKPGVASGGTIKDFERLLTIPRNTKQIATLLNMTEEDVPAVAQLFGMKQTGDGYWRPDNKPGRQELRELVDVLDVLGHWSFLTQSDRREIFTRILGHPKGERARHAEAIVRQVHFETIQAREEV